MIDGFETLARTVFGEARGEPWMGKVAVAWVVKNRVAKGGWWGKGYEEVCRKKFQFSCWNGNDPNLDQLVNVTPASPFFRECISAAACAVAGIVADPTNGATHYKVTTLPWPSDWGAEVPALVSIGNHTFYKIRG